MKASGLVGAIEDSPKPPPQRITLLLPVLNAARDIIFIATGEGKQDAMKGVVRALYHKDAIPEEFPASMATSRDGFTTWYLDEAAFKSIKDADICMRYI